MQKRRRGLFGCEKILSKKINIQIPPVYKIKKNYVAYNFIIKQDPLSHNNSKLVLKIPDENLPNKSQN